MAQHTENMRILVLNPVMYTPDNHKIPKVKSIKDTIMHTMCAGFASLGHEVTLAAATPYKPIEAEEYDFDVRFFDTYGPEVMNQHLPLSLSMARYVWRTRHDYDMILNSEAFQFHTLWAAMSSLKKTLCWHEFAGMPRRFHKMPARIWYNVVTPVSGIRNMLAVGRSKAARDFISRFMPNTAEQYVEHGVNTDKFPLAQKKEKQFIVASQLIPRKNISSIIHKFARFDALHPGYRLIIAGRGSEYENLVNLSRELGIADKVEMAGFLSHDQLAPLMASSQAMLIDTLRDLNMVSIPESIVAGTPVITNEVPSTDIVDKEGTGIKRNGWDAEDMWQVVSNKSYVDNCLRMRDKLSVRQSAQSLIDIFTQWRNGTVTLHKSPSYKKS